MTALFMDSRSMSSTIAATRTLNCIEIESRAYVVFSGREFEVELRTCGQAACRTAVLA